MPGRWPAKDDFGQFATYGEEVEDDVIDGSRCAVQSRSLHKPANCDDKQVVQRSSFTKGIDDRGQRPLTRPSTETCHRWRGHS